MLIGQLRHRVVFFEEKQTLTEIGSVRTELVEVYRCRAAIKRFSNVTDKDRVYAGEVFLGTFGVLEVRNNRRIREGQVVEMNGEKYRLLLATPRDRDHALILNITKINE